MWLATLAEARPADAAQIGDPAGDSVERFLKWEADPARRNVAVTAALPRGLNQDVLSIIAAPGDARDLFDWLCRLPFVTRQAGSWRYHEVVRAAMLRLQRAQSPARWRANHDRLAQAHAQWAADAAGDPEQAWANQDWADHTRERMYHLLCGDPVGNLQVALASAAEAAGSAAGRARQWAAIFADAGRDTGHAVLTSWGQRLSAGIHDTDLTGYLTCLIDDARLGMPAVAVALRERGMSYTGEGRYEEALDFTRAIELEPDDLSSLLDRGQVGNLMGRYDNALADFTRLIKLDPASSRAFAGRGRTYRAMIRYEEALADFDRAIELDPERVWPSANRGEIYRLIGRYNEALADLDHAIELKPGWPWMLADRGETHRLMNHYQDAIADFSHVIEIDPGHTWAIANRGQAYRAMGRYDDALADLNQATELDPAAHWIIASRGETYRAMGRCDDALADLNQAIDGDPDYAWAIASRSRTYQAMERHKEAQADFSRAVELDSRYAGISSTGPELLPADTRPRPYASSPRKS